MTSFRNRELKNDTSNLALWGALEKHPLYGLRQGKRLPFKIALSV